MQAELFSPANLSASVNIPPAPVLVPHRDWPYPGMTPEDSARKAIAMSSLFIEVIAATIKRNVQTANTSMQILALIPQDWRDLLGPFAHGSLTQWQGKQHGIDVKYVSHGENGGFHWEYRILEVPDA